MIKHILFSFYDNLYNKKLYGLFYFKNNKGAFTKIEILFNSQ